MFQMRGAFLTWTKTTHVADEGSLFDLVKNKYMFQMRGAFLTWTKTTQVPDEGSLFDLDKDNTCSR